MNQEKNSIRQKATESCGRSRACAKCNLFPKSTVVCDACRMAYIDGFIKGYQLRRKEARK